MAKSNDSYLGCLLSLLACLAGVVVVTGVLFSTSSWQTEAPSGEAECDSSGGRQSLPNAARLAPYTVEAQELERGVYPYIIRRISVEKAITEKELRALLLQQLEEIRQLDYGAMPEHRCAFTVDAYCEPVIARHYTGNPLGSIFLLRGDTRPTLSIDEKALAAIKEPPRTRFGYEEEVRRRIYWELTQANIECSDQADREFPPELTPRDSKEEAKQWTLNRRARFDELWNQRQDEITKRYGLNRAQADEIDYEGMRKHWPAPL